MTNKKVDFIGIGAQKAGTTWLYHSLKNIPDFDLPYVKELNYFSRSSEYGNSFLKHKYFVRRILKPIRTYRILSHLMTIRDKKELRWYCKWYFSNYTDRWYLSLFDNYKGITGEITPNYSILSIKDIERIYKIMPDVKIIYMIRNPIDRCISHYFDIRSRKNKNFNKNQFDFEDFNQFVNSYEQEVRSDYMRTLKNYQSVFPKEQILVCFFDSIKDNPEKLLMDIFDYLGCKSKILDSDLVIRRKVNSSKKQQIPDQAYEILKKKYQNFIYKLHKEFGGYCTKWFNDLNNKKTNKEILLPTVYPMKSCG